MKIIIDNRENDLINKLDIEFEKENLLIGDILYRNEEKEYIIIERKSINDLLASIKDGRHREQKLRLVNKQKENVQIYYLYEGDIYHHNKCDLILSCAFNTMIRDNIKVIFTRNLNDTILVIKKIFKKVSEFKEILENTNETKTMGNLESNYCETIKSEKKKNMTPSVCFLAMLKQIPGLSNKCALSISNEYSSIHSIINKYNELKTEEEKKYLLENIYIEKKRIGKKLSEKIYIYLTNENK